MAIFHGRGVSATERKTRLTESERRKRRKLMCVVTAFSVVFLYAFAWLWSGLVAVGFANIDLLWPRLASDPFPFFSLDEETLSGCLCWGAIGFLIPWVYYSMWVRKQGNYDPGAEHGDSRLAIAEDFSDITDAELPSNNLKFTTHAWMAVCPRGKELARAMTALNLNALVIGTSGGGKTSSYAKPLIAASMGTRLCPGGVGPSGIADEGFDLVFTDTKGDVLPDVGHALVNSGAGKLRQVQPVRKREHRIRRCRQSPRRACRLHGKRRWGKALPRREGGQAVRGAFRRHRRRDDHAGWSRPRPIGGLALPGLPCAHAGGSLALR